MTEKTAQDQRVVLVTGPSGAGRSTAINALEDLGFETIDNLPLSLIPRLLDGPVSERPLALGIDARNRDFHVERLINLHQELGTRDNTLIDLLYLDCERDVLLRRFSETRRRHPLAPEDAVVNGIVEELKLMEPVRLRADILIDTSALTLHDLRSQMRAMFGLDTAPGLAVSIHSFSYKRGLPQAADLVFDCRFLLNPHWNENLRELDGLNPEVAEFVSTDARFDPFLEKVRDLLLFQLPATAEEGKAHFAVAFGCTGGQHRSVAVAEATAAGLADAGWRVSIRHRELERRGSVALQPLARVETGKTRS